jgi:hypothetical protein
MTDDFRNFAMFPRRWQRPSTSLGNWSLGLVGGFVALMILLLAMLSMTRNDVILGCTLTSAAGSALAGGVVATIAIKRRGEQSILMVLPLLMGGIAAMFAFGVLVELVVRALA